VALRGDGRTRRWQSAIAITAAVSLFVALIAGSALRPKFAAATLPEPAMWSAGPLVDGAHAAPLQIHGGFQPASYAVRGSELGSSPTNKKPFHSMWMTHDRPSIWTRLAPQRPVSLVSVAFSSSEILRPRGARRSSLSVRFSGQDILTQLCVARC